MNGLLGLDDIMNMKGLPDVDIDGIDWDDPTSFFKTIGHTVPKILSPDEVRTEAKGRADAIFNSYEQLGKILERHEITLQRRWTKKTRQQRHLPLSSHFLGIQMLRKWPCLHVNP